MGAPRAAPRGAGRWALVLALLGKVLVLVLVQGLAPTAAMAGGFSVSPVRLFFGEKDRAVALRLSNESDQPLSLVTEVRAWSQDAQGQDRLEVSDDLIVSPAMLRIPPGREQVVRLILAAPRDPARQMTYRLFLREQIRAMPAADEGSTRSEASARSAEPPAVPIALALSLPVFITPPKARHDLQCAVEWPTTSEPLAHCENRGRAHARLGRLDLLEGPALLARHEGSVYLLPGVRVAVKLAAERLVDKGGPRVLRALLDDQESRQWVVPEADEARSPLR